MSETPTVEGNILKALQSLLNSFLLLPFLGGVSSTVAVHFPLELRFSRLCRTDKGETLKASYIHSVNPPYGGTTVAAELTHKFNTYENSFTIGSAHVVDPYTMVKTRLSNNGKFAMLCQREWRPKSLITVSGEYDPKANNGATKLGLALALKP